MQVLATEPHLELGFREAPSSNGSNRNVRIQRQLRAAADSIQSDAVGSGRAEADRMAAARSGRAGDLVASARSRALGPVRRESRGLAPQSRPRASGEAGLGATGAHGLVPAGSLGHGRRGAPGPRRALSALFREPAFMANPTSQERWVLPVYAWAGMQLMLRLVVAIDRARRKPAASGLAVGVAARSVAAVDGRHRAACSILGRGCGIVGGLRAACPACSRFNKHCRASPRH